MQTLPLHTSVRHNDRSILHHSVCQYKRLKHIEKRLNDGTRTDEESIQDNFELARTSNFEEYKKFTETNIIKTIHDLHLMKFNLNLQDKDGKTALHLAVKYQAPEIVKTLLELGADPNIATRTNLTPLIYACNVKHNGAIIKCLFEAGAKIEDLFIPQSTNSTCLLFQDVLHDSVENAAVITKHLSTSNLARQKTIHKAAQKTIEALQKANSEHN